MSTIVILVDVRSTPHPGCNRHHQDYYNFRIGNPYKPSFATVTGWGVGPM